MDKKQSYKKIILVMLIVCLVLSMFCLFGQVINFVYADTPNSTNVLADLQKDSNFKTSDYPDKADDYSIQVVQIAESTAKELLIYTYQPCQRTCFIFATCINMSLTETVAETKLYGLELLSSDGVFCKYKVKNVVVANIECRYYNITSIYRPWNVSIDKSSDNNNTINEIAYEVGRLYKASTIDGKVSYSWDKMETIEIINPYTGFLEYFDGYKFYLGYCHSHYIAFDTDKKIDELYEASVSCDTQEISKYIGGTSNSTSEGELQHLNILVDHEDKGENKADGIFAKKYEWKRIEKTEDFIKDPNNDLNDDVKPDIGKTKWIIRFLDTPCNKTSAGLSGLKFCYTKVTNVTILRLKFRTGIKIYDLGTISNKITGSSTIPDNDNNNEIDPLGWLGRLFDKLANALGIPTWVIYLIIALLLLGVLLPILGFIFPVVGQTLKVVINFIGKLLLWLLKAIIWIIELPFKGIVWIINKCKGGGSA